MITLLVPGDDMVLLVTRSGIAKRITAAELAGTKSGGAVIGLKGDDRLVAAMPAPDDADVVMVTDDAQALRTAVAGVSVQGRGASGVAGMKVKAGAAVIAAGLVPDGAMILSVTDTGTAKLTDAAEIPAKGRGAGGVRLTRFKTEKHLAFARVGPIDDLAVVVGQPDAPTKPDPTPVALHLTPSRRDTQSAPTDERILGAGTRRF